VFFDICDEYDRNRRVCKVSESVAGKDETAEISEHVIVM
jgi:hypothetical protein